MRPPLIDYGVRYGVSRDGFLPTLAIRTWRPRAFAAAALADGEALRSRGSYAAWLRRVAAAWSRLPPPHAATAWPLATVGPDCLDGRPLVADLADVSDVSEATHPANPAGLGPWASAPALGSALVPDAAGAGGDRTDEAFLAGAAYVAIVAAADASMLADAADDLARREAAPLGVRFLHRCRELAPGRAQLRRELTAWAADRGPGAAERVVLTARALTLEMAEVLRR